jgi:hypothetical protein
MSDQLHWLHTSNEKLYNQVLDKGILRASAWRKSESHEKRQSESLTHMKFNPATFQIQQQDSDVLQHNAQCTSVLRK